MMVMVVMVVAVMVVVPAPDPVVMVVVVMMVVTVMVVMIARHLHSILPVCGLIAGLTGRRRVGCPQRSHRVRNRVKQFGK